MEFEKKQQRANVVKMLRAGVITTEENELYLDCLLYTSDAADD